jgi:hypothetical protein
MPIWVTGDLMTDPIFCFNGVEILYEAVANGGPAYPASLMSYIAM